MTQAVDEQAWDDLYERLGPLRLPRAFCPIEPHAKQEWFLRRDELEVFFGGAAGPGKSWGLLMAALQYVDVEHYDALLLRPTLREFEKPGGLIDIAHEWLDRSEAIWHGGRRQWTFPSKSTLTFGYLSTRADLRQFKGPSYSFVGFDELTGFPETLYRSMFRALRQAKDRLQGVPVRMRSASNPGDSGHAWVKTRLVDPRSRVPGAVYVPATIHDNPHMDYEQYLLSLAHLDPVERQRLIDGDWDVMEEGGKFNRKDFTIIDEAQAPHCSRTVRYWDLAATEPTPTNPDPDETVGLKLGVTDSGHFVIWDVHGFKLSDEKVEEQVRQTAYEDGPGVPVWVEQEPGASGKLLMSHYKRKVLAGFAFHAGLPRGGNKEVRARPVAAAVANGLVRIVRGRNTLRFLDQCSLFPMAAHDDMVDALSGAHTALTRTPKAASGQVSVPTGRIPGVDNNGASGLWRG